MKRLKENCPQCNKLRKQQMKEELLRQQAEYQKEQARLQEQMFQQARKNVQQNYYSYQMPYTDFSYSNPLGGFQ